MEKEEEERRDDEEEEEVYTTWKDMMHHWPWHTVFIISNEFCERFSFYGMRTVLTFYILNVLRFSEKASTISFNLFTALCYITPIFGSVLADGYIGKFRTIFYISILYSIGQALLAVASTQKSTSVLHPYLDLLGLLIIGAGTGGIKPCVATFGGDQFPQNQERMISIFFSAFYFAINAGSFISTLITPMFRALPCMGENTCFPLAFGVPAALMIVATVLFMAGSRSYKKVPPKENVLIMVVKIMFGAVKNKLNGIGGDRDYWVERYLETHNCEEDHKCLTLREETNRNSACSKKSYVKDIQTLFRVVVMFLPAPFFWALYDQQASVWLLQAVAMDCNVFGYALLPDQMQALNAVLILVLIPLFQVVVYPLAELCFKVTPLRKMAAGCIVAALSFVVTGILQLQINKTLPPVPPDGQVFVSFMNSFDSNCEITVSSLKGGFDPRILSANTSTLGDKMFTIDSGTVDFKIKYGRGCPTSQDTFNGHFVAGQHAFVSVGPTGIFSNAASIAKPTEGTSQFSLGISLALNNPYAGSIALCRVNGASSSCDHNHHNDFVKWTNGEPKTPSGSLASASVSLYEYKPVASGKWKLYFLDKEPTKEMSSKGFTATYSGVEIEINGQGGVYTLLVTGDGITTGKNEKHVYQSAPDNSINILWQVPQIILITASEVMFSITGNEFAYSQSAASMKAVIQAIWLLSVAIGDLLITVATAASPFENKAYFTFSFAVLMMVITAIFIILSTKYTYLNVKEKEEDEVDEESGSKSKGDNESMSISLSSKRRRNDTSSNDKSL